MKHKDMSNFELSAAIAMKVYGVKMDEIMELAVSNSKRVPIWKCGPNESKTFDIENLNDIMPLAFKHNMSLIFTDKLWFAGIANLEPGMWNFVTDENGYCVSFEVADPSPQRAAALCFLDMMEALDAKPATSQ